MSKLHEEVKGVITVLKPGTKIILNPDGEHIDAHITKVLITELGISYTAEWWSGRDQKTGDFILSEFKVRPDDFQFTKIGFHKEQV